MARPDETLLRRLALALFGVIAALDVVYVQCGRAVEGDPGLTYPDAGIEIGEVLVILAAAVVGLVLAWMRPHNAVGWLVSASGLCLALADAGMVYGARALLIEPALPAGAGVLAFTAPFWIPALLIGPTFLLLRYPGGRVEGRWARRVERLTAAGLVPLLLSYALSPPAVTDVVADASPPFDVPDAVLGTTAVIGGVLVVGGLLFSIGDAVRRLIRSADTERAALALLLTSAVAVVVMSMVSPYEWMLALAQVAVMVAVAVGVLKYGALGIDVTVLYGDNRDPFAALTRLGGPMDGAVDKETLPAVLASLADAIDVRGVAIEGPFHALSGTLPEDPVALPLTFGDRELGRLLIGDRLRGGLPGRAERRVAEAVAPLIAAVLHAVHLAEELRTEQLRVVEATHAERGRLRRELHDGLGPSLTGIGLGLEALAPSVPDRGSEMVARLRAEVASSLVETQRIIDDLRPVALDGADLATALRHRTAQIASTDVLEISLDAPDVLSGLPAPVAAAAFRIAEEALTNVVRHADASRCRVRLRLDGDLLIEVTDDGRGFSGPRPGGVGLASMQERAERLGGRLDVVPLDPGTRVTAVLPVRAT